VLPEVHVSSRGLSTTIVVPCFNEAERLDPDRFVRLAADASIDLVFVDDGSTDDTGCLLGELAMLYPDWIEVVSLGQNSGKGEAVRAGISHALSRGAAIVGYYDADMATPPDELRRLVDTVREYPAVSVVIASRVRLLGYDVRRPPMRHYLGRLFATFSGMALSLPVYDTQCGAKLFRRSDALAAAVSEPFASRWAFDVELLSRLIAGTATAPGLAPGSFLEVPLREWSHVDGSKLRSRAALRAAVDLVTIARRSRTARTTACRPGVGALEQGSVIGADAPVLMAVPRSEDAA
jgi:glycosyltransferase involved in cell wall biosynthesis